MKSPIIGMNMDYTCYPKYPVTDPQFRECYDIYAPYVDAVSGAGGIPLPIPCLENKPLLEKYINLIDGFVFTGSEDYPPEYYDEVPCPQIKPCHPRRVNADMMLVPLVLAAGIPVLGVCGGLQLINIAKGGKLIQHIETVNAHRASSYTKDAEHSVRIVTGTLMASVFDTDCIVVNSAHHQAVHPEHIGAGLRVAALADDGVIEAIESVEKRFLLGVQWHPERMVDDGHRHSLFNAFIKACLDDKNLNKT